MNKQENFNQKNSFLKLWIQGQLSSHELYEFIHSDNYKNLVQSKLYKS